MLLDRGLPAIEGLDLLARLRSRGPRTPDAGALRARQPAGPGRGPRRRRRGLPRQAVRRRRAAGPAPGAAAPAPRAGRPAARRPAARSTSATRSVRLEDGAEVALSERECDAAGRRSPAARAGCFSRAELRRLGLRGRRGGGRRGHLRALPAPQARPRGSSRRSAGSATGWAGVTGRATRADLRRTSVRLGRADRPARRRRARGRRACCSSWSTSAPPTQAADRGAARHHRERRRADEAPPGVHVVVRDAGRADASPPGMPAGLPRRGRDRRGAPRRPGPRRTMLERTGDELHRAHGARRRPGHPGRARPARGRRAARAGILDRAADRGRRRACCSPPLVAAWLARRAMPPLAESARHAAPLRRRRQPRAAHPADAAEHPGRSCSPAAPGSRGSRLDRGDDLDGVLADTGRLTDILDDLLMAADTRADPDRSETDLAVAGARVRRRGVAGRPSGPACTWGARRHRPVASSTGSRPRCGGP